MENETPKKLRSGWTTGACATAGVRAALIGLWGQGVPQRVQITLPRGQTPEFAIGHFKSGDGWVEAGIIKDAGDDPDVTHGAMIIVRVQKSTTGVVFRAGSGVGTITKPGLPVPVGEPAINPVPRQMMAQVVQDTALEFDQPGNIAITISIPGGLELAAKTWNPRLGIVGGLSILGTTGIVRPFSCSAWIASIHRGIDVARANGLTHVAGCTGSTSERAVQEYFNLPDHAMLDMGDFAGGLLKYLARHPVDRVTIGGGIGKLAKLAQGAVDLHSGRSQVDITQLAEWMDMPELTKATTALHALEMAGPGLAEIVAKRAREKAQGLLKSADCRVDVMVIDRTGNILAQAR